MKSFYLFSAAGFICCCLAALSFAQAANVQDSTGKQVPWGATGRAPMGALGNPPLGALGSPPVGALGRPPVGASGSMRPGTVIEKPAKPKAPRPQREWDFREPADETDDDYSDQ